MWYIPTRFVLVAISKHKVCFHCKQGMTPTKFLFLGTLNVLRLTWSNGWCLSLQYGREFEEDDEGGKVVDLQEDDLDQAFGKRSSGKHWLLLWWHCSVTCCGLLPSPLAPGTWLCLLCNVFTFFLIFSPTWLLFRHSTWRKTRVHRPSTDHPPAWTSCKNKGGAKLGWERKGISGDKAERDPLLWRFWIRQWSGVCILITCFQRSRQCIYYCRCNLSADLCLSSPSTLTKILPTYSTELWSVRARINLQHQPLMSILRCSYFAQEI